MDLISCRNLLIYLGSAFQSMVVPMFHFALAPKGYLFLGTSETVNQHGELFAPIDKKHRIFQRRDATAAALRLPQFSPAGRAPRQETGRQAWHRAGPTCAATSRAHVLDRFAPAHVVVNREGEVLHYSARTGKYLEPASGLPSRDLLSMTRRDLRIELRAALRDAQEMRRGTTRSGVQVVLDDRVQLVDITVEPLPGHDGDPLFLVVFRDAAPPAQADGRSRGGPSGDGVERLELELHETRDRLQATIEEYETAVEELKSANEELQSTNEELQSSNEEHETAREELQSVNEELHTVNAELNAKVDELDRAHADLRNVFDATRVATIFLDRDLIIRTFTPSARDVQPDLDRPRPPADRHLSHLDSTGDLRAATASCARERRGRRAAGPPRRRDHVPDAPASLPRRSGRYRGRAGDVHRRQHRGPGRGASAHAGRGAQPSRPQHADVVGAVATQTLARSGAPAGFINDLVGQIHAMDRSYALVSRAKSGEVNLRDLLMEELSSAQGRSKSTAHVTVDGIPVDLKPQAALALSLVIHELASNAHKHGALSSPKGGLNVRWALGNPHGKLILTWEEKAGKKIKRPAANGFGLELVDRELKSALGGTAEFKYGAQGLTVKILLPGEPRRWTALAGPADKS